MQFIYAVLVISVTLLDTLVLCNNCPNKGVMNPCTCVDNIIKCSSRESFDLKKKFENISQHLVNGQKMFTKLILSSERLTEIENNTFSDITFQSIEITGSKNLQKISSDAFTNRTPIEEFTQKGVTKLDANGNITDLLNFLKSLTNVKAIHLDLYNLKTIPENAFRSSDLTNAPRSLKVLWFSFIERGSITSVENYAFYDLSGLSVLGLDNNEINFIKQHAFHFGEETNQTLYVYLNGNQLNSSSIEQGTFVNSKRPLTIDLSINYFDYLDEKVFEPILRIDKRNKFILNDNHFECDCRMRWLLRDKSYIENQIEYGKCKSGLLFSSLNETYFKNC